MYAETHGRTILVVEDEPFVAEVIKCALQDSHEIRWAADVPGALAALAEFRPDMVLVDCLLPGGNLNEVLGKADVLGVSAVLMSGSDDMLARLGAVGYPCLHKPFELDDLFQFVDGALQSRWDELHAT